MNRRKFLQSAAAISILPIGCTNISRTGKKGAAIQASVRRVRPGDPGWPSAVSWERLNREVRGRLMKVQSPVDACRMAPDSAECKELFRKLKNPYYIGDHPALTQTSGWVDAWTSAPSVYAVAATKTEDVVAAVNFAGINFLETFPIFATAVLVAHLTGHRGTLTLWGANLYFWGRIVYAIAYAAGFPLVRSAIWNVAVIGIVLVLVGAW